MENFLGFDYIFKVVNDLKADQKIVDRLQDISVRHAEGRNKTFHCISVDCTHWWFIEPEEANNIILCDVIIFFKDKKNFLDLEKKDKFLSSLIF